MDFGIIEDFLGHVRSGCMWRTKVPMNQCKELSLWL